MNPAFPVIFLTTLIGVGQGLFVALYAGELLGLTGAVPMPPDRGFFALGSLVSLAFLAAGLAASFLHLGRPERAWRAASMWRTSWLSREVIALPVFMATVAAYGAAHDAGWHLGMPGAPGALVAAIGIAGVILCVALFVCTGMIYACIRFLQEWASPLTLMNYFLLGTASGFTLATAFAAFAAPELTAGYGWTAIALTASGLLFRLASLWRNARLRPKSTMQTATGIRHPRIVQKAQGAMGGSFNTREYFHGKSRDFLRAVKWAFLALTFPVPALLLVAGLATGSLPLLAAAFLVQYAGLIAERWFFFAQANHPQNLYYQRIS
ncbi:MAG: dimethyl sulfoxide reductase anchor subunit family protein [Burkholderiaceae bacterium]